MGAPHRRDRWWAVAWPERDEASDRARAERIWTSVLRGLTPFGADVWPTCNANSNENYKGASATSGNGLTTIIRAEAGLPPAKWMERNLATNGWPTATASDAWGSDLDRNGMVGKHNLGLGTAARINGTWPTPSSGGESGGPHGIVGGTGHRQMLRDAGLDEATVTGMAGGSLNPDWVDLLQGYPIGYTLPEGEPMLTLPGAWPAGTTLWFLSWPVRVVPATRGAARRVPLSGVYVRLSRDLLTRPVSVL